MPSREEFEAAHALYDEAVALYEAAKAEFEILQRTIAETIHNGRPPSDAALSEAERLRTKLFVAAERVSWHKRRPSAARMIHVDGRPVRVTDLKADPAEVAGLGGSEIRFAVDAATSRFVLTVAELATITVTIDGVLYSGRYRLRTCSLGAELSHFTFVAVAE